jgi:succinate dehydrogenase / fumarate reductase flavoprotein subunit/L-aspartate oxidase
MSKGIQREEAYRNYLERKERPLPRLERDDTEELLRRFHPDYAEDKKVSLRVGVNRGDRCHRQVAELLQADPMIDDADLAGAQVVETDILVIGGGGAACAAALVASDRGARVILVTKLRLGDSNTVMAEGGIQAAIDKDDTPRMHFEDTLKGGHNKGDKELIARMVTDGPEVILWLIRQGMQFDQDQFGDLLTRRAGGATADRVVYCSDYTGLEMMRVLREGVRKSTIEVFEYSPAVELLSNEEGNCAGAVIFSLDSRTYTLIKAEAVILATGGIGRLHLNGFPTSNHFGATGDGMVLAYRIGAKLLDLDSYQYHPTGMAFPVHLRGFLVTEGVRSAGAHLLNGLGERFVDELRPRDYLTAAVLRECSEGRAVAVDEDTVGVWLDTPTLERAEPGILQKLFPKLLNRFKKSEIDPEKEPLLVFPTLHYQNGGVMIDENGQTSVVGLYSAGEVCGGIHGTNRIMGNALLEIISFGRRAGEKASENIRGRGHKNVTIEHLRRLRRELALAGMSMASKSPILFPKISNFRGGSGPGSGDNDEEGQPGPSK